MIVISNSDLHHLFQTRLLGLSNNFAYVIMLSAAHDILDTKKDEVM